MAYLQLNRLIILKTTTPVYDETFHTGVNIIRGENGVGKSTIANAIYYVLGGDFTKWLPEIEKCDFVVAEIDLDGTTLTVKREINRLPMQPMFIFYGNYETSNQNASGWVIHPYKRSNKAPSFSQVFFKALTYPEIETADDEYITFNQVLRLMYIDQTSPLDELMKDIDFDSPLIRKTTADLLLGVYDNALFTLQLLVKNLKKDESEFESELKLLRSVYSSVDTTALEKSLKEMDDQLSRIDETLKNNTSIVLKKADQKANKLTALQQETTDISGILQKKLNEQSLLQYDASDSREFISELASQIAALEQSEAIRGVLGDLKVSYCPSCLQTSSLHEPGQCELCKQPLDQSVAKAQILRIRQQLESQIRESQLLLSETENTLTDLSGEIETLNAQLKIKQRALNKLVQDNNSDRNNLYDELLVTKGKLIQQILNTQDDLKMAKKYWSIYAAYQKVKGDIAKANESIEEKKAKQKQNFQLALEQVNKYANHLLANDGGYEAAFAQNGLVDLDFAKNTYSLNGRNNFSASSQVILKNSIRFGIFFASLKLDFMRYPQFILCDNIEDKGMNEVRSKNFQKNLVNLASAEEFKDKRFQVIYTTSMVEKSVDVPSFTIGKYYTPLVKTLDLKAYQLSEGDTKQNVPDA